MVWLWIAIEPKSKSILDMRISLEEGAYLLLNKQFLQELIKKYGKNPVSTDNGSGGTWYLPQACRFLKLRHHHTHSYILRKKYHRERTIQYIKDRTQNALMIIFHVKKITVH